MEKKTERESEREGWKHELGHSDASEDEGKQKMGRKTAE